MNGKYEVKKAADHLRTINTWAQVGRGLKFRDARDHVLREANSPLKFPISGSNDVVLALRQYVRQALHLPSIYQCIYTHASEQNIHFGSGILSQTWH